MKKIDQFIKELANHEKQKTLSELRDPREELLVYSGVRLNWIADFLSNPKIKWELKTLKLESLEFTGKDLFLIQHCQRNPVKLGQFASQDESVRMKYKKIASFDRQPIIVREGNTPSTYKIVDGMHRVIGAALRQRKEIEAFIPLNEKSHKPICEAHTIYDLIRGFYRNAKDEEGKKQLYYGLKLLVRSYENVDFLLENRFSSDYIYDKESQEIIKQVIDEAKEQN